MLSTSSQTDNWGINTKIKLVIPACVFPSSLETDKLWAMGKGGAGSQNSLEEQKLGICCQVVGKGQFLTAFSTFSSPLPTAPSRGSFLPFSHLFQEYAK